MERLALETEKEWEAQGGVVAEFAAEQVEAVAGAACEEEYDQVVPARTVVDGVH